jgi:hypothetical protein
VGWYHRTGKRLGDAVKERHEWGAMFLSPDAKRLAAAVVDETTATTKPHDAAPTSGCVNPPQARPPGPRGGREIVYATLNGDLYSVDVLPGETFATSAPKRVAQWPEFVNVSSEFTADGERIIVVEPPPGAKNTPIHVITNWTALVKK